MNDRAELYRMRALRCERMAQCSTQRVAKNTFVDLATQWLELAQQIEKLAWERRYRYPTPAGGGIPAVKSEAE